MKIYYGCGVRIEDNEPGSRVFTLSESKDDTEEFIVNNATDINEAGYYPYAVLIEETLPDIYFSNCQELQWYKFNQKIRKYEEICRPKQLERFTFNGPEIGEKI